MAPIKITDRAPINASNISVGDPPAPSALHDYSPAKCRRLGEKLLKDIDDAQAAVEAGTFHSSKDFDDLTKFNLYLEWQNPRPGHLYVPNWKKPERNGKRYEAYKLSPRFLEKGHTGQFENEISKDGTILHAAKNYKPKQLGKNTCPRWSTVVNVMFAKTIGDLKAGANVNEPELTKEDAERKSSESSSALGKLRKVHRSNITNEPWRDAMTDLLYRRYCAYKNDQTMKPQIRNYTDDVWVELSYGTSDFTIMLGTPLGMGVGELLKNHPEKFCGVTLDKIMVNLKRSAMWILLKDHEDPAPPSKSLSEAGSSRASSKSRSYAETAVGTTTTQLAATSLNTSEAFDTSTFNKRKVAPALRRHRSALTALGESELGSSSQQKIALAAGNKKTEENAHKKPTAKTGGPSSVKPKRDSR